MNRLAIAILVLTAGCVSPQWKTLAQQCAQVLQEAQDPLQRCKNHLDKFHDGARLKSDGTLLK